MQPAHRSLPDRNPVSKHLSPEAALATVETATGQLSQLDPEDFVPYFAAMNRRSAAIAVIEQAASRGELPDERLFRERLESQYRAGVQLQRKLRIARARLRARFERLLRDKHLVGSISRVRGTRTCLFDYRG